MGVMTYLRERMGKIVAFGIGFSLLAFVGEEAIRSGNSIFHDDRNLLGEVAGAHDLVEQPDLVPVQSSSSGWRLRPHWSRRPRETVAAAQVKPSLMRRRQGPPAPAGRAQPEPTMPGEPNAARGCSR